MNLASLVRLSSSIRGGFATASCLCAYLDRSESSCCSQNDKFCSKAAAASWQAMASLTCVNVQTACILQPQRQCCKSSMYSAVTGLHPRQSALVRSHSSCCKRPTRWTPHGVSCAAGDFAEGELIKGIKAGDKLKVKESRLVYHAPKHKVGCSCKLLNIAAMSATHDTGFSQTANFSAILFDVL